MKSLLCALIVFVVSVSQAQGTEYFNVPASDAPHAINTWSRQAGIQVAFVLDQKEYKNRTTRSIQGRYEPLDALTRILIDMDLEINVLDGNIVTVLKRSGPKVCKPWLGVDAPLPPCKQIPVEYDDAHEETIRQMREGLKSL